MNEAIKGQDKLKISVEKLEAELFKDWPPCKNVGIVLQGGNFSITGFTISYTGYPVNPRDLGINQPM